MKRLLAIVLLGLSSAFAQTVQTTPNLITSGTTHTWTGVATGTVPSNFMPGGPQAKYDPAANTIYFSYGSSTAAQTFAINQALQNAGAGLTVQGYSYSWDIRNMNGDNRQGGTDTLTATVLTYNSGNSTIRRTDSWTYNTKFDWTTFSGDVNYVNPGAPSTFGNMVVKFQGMDSGYWAGYFGPQVRNVNVGLRYTVDPCATNPAYSTSCANYNTVSTSGNLFTGTTGAQAYAINQALALAGANTTIHGFDYGYNYAVGGNYCNWELLGICVSTAPSSASVTTTLTNSAGIVGYTETNNHTSGSGTYTKSLRLNASVPMSTLGTFSMTPSTVGNANINGMYSNAVYTPDPCTSNPLSSTSCPGYQQAYQDQQCSINPLYATVCPGYTAAYLTQQCSANSLYSQSCPGYAQAYFTQQCTNNPLSDTTCPGYQQAYFNQQCTASPLYSSQCPGYQQAYLTQQCNISSLYSNQCPGYAAAYHDQQCSISALYMSDCPGYQQAYFSQQCTANTLYNSQCPGYQVAYHNQQCGINPLYATDCAGYAAAYHTQQCTANPLYMTDCPGYQAAYLTQQCNISQLYSTSCPGYQQAYFNQQCQLNGLYDRTCPNYATAYAAKNILAAPTTPAPVATTTTDTSTTSASVAIKDPVVQSVTTTSSTTSPTSATSVVGPVSVINPPKTAGVESAISSVSVDPPVPAAKQQAQQQETKKTEGQVNRVVATAKGNVAAAAKEAAAKSAGAKTLEDQAASQGLVVGLMGYVPGFSAYQNSIVPDTMANAVARQYHKPTVDNRNAQRRLSGASELKWQEMVDSQYKQ